MTAFGLDLGVTTKKWIKEIKDDDVSGLAAELSYRFFLALFPFFLFVAAMGGFIARTVGVENPAERFLDQFGSQLPDDAASVVRTQITEVVNGSDAGLISVSILGAIWAAAGGVSALMKAVNRAYDIPESRPFWKKTLISVGVTVGGGVLSLLMIGVLVGTQVYAADIASWLGLESQWQLAINLLRFPLLLVALAAIVGVVYWIAPNIGLPLKWISPGAVMFAIVWLVASIGFGFYVANFSSYNATYGALGGVVILMLWFYISSFVLLAGAELNAVLDEERCGPVLAERRERVAEELRKKGVDMPGPENGRVNDGLDEVAAQAAARGANGGTGTVVSRPNAAGSRLRSASSMKPVTAGSSLVPVGTSVQRTNGFSTATEDRPNPAVALAVDELEEEYLQDVTSFRDGDGHHQDDQSGVWHRADGFVKQHAVPSALGALTAGYVIGRMKR